MASSCSRRTEVELGHVHRYLDLDRRHLLGPVDRCPDLLHRPIRNPSLLPVRRAWPMPVLFKTADARSSFLLKYQTKSGESGCSSWQHWHFGQPCRVSCRTSCGFSLRLSAGRPVVSSRSQRDFPILAAGHTVTCPYAKMQTLYPSTTDWMSSRHSSNTAAWLAAAPKTRLKEKVFASGFRLVGEEDDDGDEHSARGNGKRSCWL